MQILICKAKHCLKKYRVYDNPIFNLFKCLITFFNKQMRCESEKFVTCIIAVGSYVVNVLHIAPVEGGGGGQLGL